MKLPKHLQECIQLCWECRNDCQKVLFNHCLDMGEDHTDPLHVSLMMDCIQMCQVAADAMVRQSIMHKAICAVTAAICDACAQSCEELSDDPEMEQCADICRECADSCRQMSSMKMAA
jgi:hypothetical protein